MFSYKALKITAARFSKGLLVSPFVLNMIFGGIALAQSSGATQQQTSVDTTAIDQAICWLMHFQTGTYGALLMAVAGLGAVVGGAVGNYKTAINCLVVGVGAWLIQPVAQIMFEYWPDCVEALKAPAGMASN